MFQRIIASKLLLGWAICLPNHVYILGMNLERENPGKILPFSLTIIYSGFNKLTCPASCAFSARAVDANWTAAVASPWRMSSISCCCCNIRQWTTIFLRKRYLEQNQSAILLHQSKQEENDGHSSNEGFGTPLVSRLVHKFIRKSGFRHIPVNYFVKANI